VNKEFKRNFELLKKEMNEREAAFITAYHEIHDEKLNPDDLDDMDNLMSLCEVYYRLRTGKPILK